MKVKIYGAGSIGNHLANASRQMSWSVDICDIDAVALERTKNDIYPSRYKKWDNQIRLFENNKSPKEYYDLIFIGTPPNTHIQLALEALEQSPKAVIIEKPLCCPDLGDVFKLQEISNQKKIPIFVGYDHVVGKASEKLTQLLSEDLIGKILTIDFEFREHWGGIFAAHHWLKGPEETYLGNIKQGGGASGEHSHALNLWQYFSNILGAGSVTEVQAVMDIVSDKDVYYDRLCLLNLKTESGLIGRVVQDVITKPSRKWGRIQGENGFYEWECGFENGKDRIIQKINSKREEIFIFDKTRPDDFINELKHIELMVKSRNFNSPISLKNGLDTMRVLSAAHKSNDEKKIVFVDYI
jgi:predicted dehydrogenase